jgi:molybdate transport system permease protein
VSRAFVGLLAALGVGFLLLPLLGLLVRSIETNAWGGLSTEAVSAAISLSARTTLVAMLLTLAFGTPLAYALARWRFPLRRWVNVLVELPIVLPPAVAGLALLTAFGRRGLLGPVLDDLDIAIVFTTTAVILAQVFVAAPFYIRAAVVGFASVPQEIEDAARVDGADGLALFTYVTLPLARSALGAGLVLSWARAVGEFGATLMFAGSLQGETETMPLLIFRTFQSDVDAAIATGLILVGIALIALLLVHLLERDTS